MTTPNKDGVVVHKTERRKIVADLGNGLYLTAHYVIGRECRPEESVWLGLPSRGGYDVGKRRTSGNSMEQTIDDLGVMVERMAAFHAKLKAQFEEDHKA